MSISVSACPFGIEHVRFRPSAIFKAGQYVLITNEEPIEEFRFPIYRRVATLIFLPADAGQPFSIKIVGVDTADLAAAHERDQRATPPRSPP
jgi:hypothetical protein